MSRRSFLGLFVAGGSLLVASVVAVPAVLMGLSPALRPRRPEAWRAIGRVDDFPIGEVHEHVIPRDGKDWPRSFPQRPVFVWRRSETELVVFSRSCTDMGCPLNYDRGSACFFCPCHGGIFAQDGQRLAGPPNGPMFRYAHRVRDGVIEIDVTSVPRGV